MVIACSKTGKKLRNLPAKRGRNKAATGPILVDLEIIEYLEFILSHPTMKEPLTVWATLSKRLRILPIIVQRLFPIPACSSDVEILFSQAGCSVNSRWNQLGSESLNELIVLNAYLTYKDAFLPRDIKNIQRQENLKTFVYFSSETCTLISNYSDWHDDEESDLGMSDSELDNELF